MISWSPKVEYKAWLYRSLVGIGREG